MEVMLCIAIMGFMLAAAFSLANRNQTSSRQSQERSEALHVADTQLELLRAYTDKNELPPDEYFCMEPEDTIPPLVPGPGIVPIPDAPSDNPTAATPYPAKCGFDRYSFAIWSGTAGTPHASSRIGVQEGVYAVTVRWDSAGGDIPVEETKVLYAINNVTDPGFRERPPPTGPSATITSSTPSVFYPPANGGANISWTAGIGSVSCTTTNFPASMENPFRTEAVGFSGNFPTGSLSVSKSYTITCYNDFGAAGATAPVGVSVSPPVPAKVTVTARMARPAPGQTTPPCNAPYGLSDRTGASITLSGGAGSSTLSTSPGSSATFDNLLFGTTYSATFTPPAGNNPNGQASFLACSPPASASATTPNLPAGSGSNTLASPTLIFRPNCYTRDDSYYTWEPNPATYYSDVVGWNSYWINGPRRGDLDGYLHGNYTSEFAAGYPPIWSYIAVPPANGGNSPSGWFIYRRSSPPSGIYPGYFQYALWEAVWHSDPIYGAPYYHGYHWVHHPVSTPVCPL